MGVWKKRSKIDHDKGPGILAVFAILICGTVCGFLVAAAGTVIVRDAGHWAGWW